jgi:two-component system phosphate regulon sensor histidine kinase PhoR
VRTEVVATSRGFRRLDWADQIARLKRRRGLVLGVSCGAAVLVAAGEIPVLIGLGAAAAAIGFALLERNEPASAGSPGDRPSTGSRPKLETDRPQDKRAAWSAVLSGLPRAVIVLDRNGWAIDANPVSTAMLGEIELGRHISLSIRAPEMLGAIDGVLADGRARSVDVVERVPFERVLRVTVSAVPGSMTGPGTPAVVLLAEDGSEAERLSRRGADFVANASHELRTPLAVLRGCLETLEGAAKDDVVARTRFLGRMREQAIRMSRLIDDLLLLSRVEGQERIAPQGKVELNAVVADVVALLSADALEKKMRLQFTPTEGEAWVAGAHDELVQVFQNLIQNAIKYGREHGQVEVAISNDPGGRLAVTVKDDGPGIAPEHLPRLTERFYRVSAAHSRGIGGTGLGLAIVKHVLNRHHGELRIESEVGKGSMFTVLLQSRNSEIAPAFRKII